MKITQKILSYQHQISDNNYTEGKINGARDLSALNRKGVAMTDKKGVPYIFRYAVTCYPAIQRGDDTVGDQGTGILYGGAAATSQDDQIIQLSFLGAPNTWVTRNAGVKIHNARESFMKERGIKKKERGAYDHTIRYKLESTDNYLDPVNGQATLGGTDGDTASRPTINGGTWDHTRLIFPDDPTGATLHLCGGHSTEETTSTFTSLCAPQLYLASRGTIDSDSNEEFDSTPQLDSVLHRMMSPVASGLQDEVRAEVRDQADNPPYDISVLNNDQYEMVELGRLQFVAGQASSATCVIDAPYGLFDMHGIASTSRGFTNVGVHNLEINVELVGMFPMEA